MGFAEIDFNPFTHNILDYVGSEFLSVPDGEKVTIKRSNMEFVVTIGNKTFRSKDNIMVSYFLNTHQVGMKTK